MHARRTIETLESASQARICRLPDVSLAEARARLRAALGAHGFAVLSEVDLADLLHRRLDAKLEGHLIIESCHPKLAEMALAVARDAGLLTSFRFALWREGNDAAIATLAPIRLAAALGREHLAGFAMQADEQLDAVFARLDRPAAAEPLPPPPAGPLLDDVERAALKEAASRHRDALLVEAAGTESRDLQHGLAETMDRLDRIIRKL